MKIPGHNDKGADPAGEAPKANADEPKKPKAELKDASDAARLARLKSERDALKRAIRTGTIWTDGGEH